ncbi:MAG: hypothetical protein EOM76_01525, partial [Sphingobacteriia bacterium]|nr:hypothetical protein [Sphingobacteriia bacterium]
SYHSLALRLLHGKGFSFPVNWWPATHAGDPTAHWSFLYTFFVTAIYGVFGEAPLAVRLIQSILVGILQPILVYQIGKRLFSAPTGLVAAALDAGYFYFIRPRTIIEFLPSFLLHQPYLYRHLPNVDNLL